MIRQYFEIIGSFEYVEHVDCFEYCEPCEYFESCGIRAFEDCDHSESLEC